MISMSVNHPEIMDFIELKTDLDKVTKANISVRITDEFMKAVQNDEEWVMSFKVPESDETITKTAPAKKIMRMIAETNHDYAEPKHNWAL